MSSAGISPPLNTSPGTLNVPSDAASSGWEDLDQMLTPILALPEVEKTPVSFAARENSVPDSLGVVVCLDLDSAAPHLDLVRQLTALIGRVVRSRGVVLSGGLALDLLKVAQHARCVADAQDGQVTKGTRP